MSKFIINGNKPLKGEVRVSGSKNAALPILAATLLGKGDFLLSNVPNIKDVLVMLEILKFLGAKVKKSGDKVFINTDSVNRFDPPDHLVSQMRASILLVGPLLARFGKAEIAAPGGCNIGSRRVDTHLRAMKAFGAKVKIIKNKIYFDSNGGLKPGRIILEEMSVTATENILMAVALMPQKSEIRLCAMEPHVVDLENFLEKMGVKISGKGTHSLKVEGKKKLKAVEHKIISDMIEAGTYILAGAVTEGEVKVTNCDPKHLDYFLAKLTQAGVRFELGKNFVKVFPSKKINAVYLKTDCYPGFATDFQAIFAVLMTKAEGGSILFETMFEGRFNYINELNKMGAKTITIDPHKVKIIGPTKLRGSDLISFDLRAGATMILAGLAASGQSVISGVDLIDRGYEKIEQKLKKIGADITRTN